jgi:hypothetical protein
VTVAGLSNDTVALAIGTVLAIGALAFVLAPLVSTRGIDDAHNDRAPSTPTDLQTGVHLTDTNDPTKDPTKDSANDDAVEAAIRRARANLKSCANCGPRIELDAAYCSNCGKYLSGVCARCHAAVTGTGSAFCGACGGALNEFV